MSTLYIQWIEYLKKSLMQMNVVIDTIEDGSIPIYYFEYYLRTLQIQKYEVLVSKELIENPLYLNYKSVIDEIIKKAQSEVDLNPHLSKGIKKIATPDAMLNDWGVHHLHLSSELEDDGFVKRTKELLFVYRNVHSPNKLYFLDIFNHGDWSKQQTIKILHNNWADDIESHKIKNLIDIQLKPKDEEIKALRKANVNSAVVLQDKLAYLTLGGGLTMMGTNTESSMFQIQYMKFFNKLESEIVKEFNVKSEQLHLSISGEKAYIYVDLGSLDSKMIPIKILILSDVEFI